MHFRSLRIKEVRKETPDCVSLSFDIPDQWKEEFRFRQGQNITIKMDFNGQEVRRSYSICSSPFDNELRVAVKKLSSGRFSVFANEQLKKGETLEVLPPSGKFLTELHPGQAKNYVAFAAGSGITPVISIIKTTLLTEPGSRFTLVYGNRNRSSIIFREGLEALKNKYMDRFRMYHILSREITDSPIYQGRINAEKCAELGRLIDFPAADEFFICGPEEMIIGVASFLEQKGIEKRRIHFELFTVPGQERGLGKVTQAADMNGYEGKNSEVSLRLDGQTHLFNLSYDGLSVLEAALRQGADLPYACKGGVCSTCRAKLLEGKVEMDANYALEPDEIAAGYILTCQSHPRSEKLVVDFDMN